MKNPLLQTFAPQAIYQLVSLLGGTLKVRHWHYQHYFSLKRKYPQCLYAFWHENIASCLLLHKKMVGHYCSMASPSQDGQLAKALLTKFGHKTFVGSSNRDGLKGLKEMCRFIASSNYSSVLTVDGPKGPRRKCKLGITQMARLTGLPIVPFAIYLDNPWVFKKSWDQTKIPRPFSTIHFMHGNPIQVNKDSPAPTELASQIGLEIDALELKLKRWAQKPQNSSESYSSILL